MKKIKKEIISYYGRIGIINSFAFWIISISNKVFASSSTGIGTAEVQTATENIKRVITSIAMPLRWSTYLCKYSNCSN